MRRILLSAFTIFSFFSLEAQTVDIPDPILKDILLRANCVFTASGSKTNADENNDGELQIEEVEKVTKLHLSYLSEMKDVQSFEGLSAFKNLETLKGN